MFTSGESPETQAFEKAFGISFAGRQISVLPALCTPEAFATCSRAGAIRPYHDAVVAELVDAQR
jgi:hypothetical protein